MSTFSGEDHYLTLQSVDKVVQELHKKGFKTSRRKTYSKPQVSRILQNIRYTGRQQYEGKILDGNWPAIRSQSTHEKIQKVLLANRRSNHSPTRMMQNYIYLFQGLLKCHRCHSSMFPRPGTGRHGRYYPYYVCTKADKTEGIDCEEMYLPAEAIDKAIIQFLRNLRLDPAVIEKVVKRANEATSSRVGALQKDLEQIKDRLKEIRIQTSNLVDILAKKGAGEFEAVKSRLESLDQQEKELVVEEKRIEQEIRAEKVQAGAAREQIQILNLFNDLYEINQDKPDRIKMLLPRFINYVVCHMIDKKKGIGRLDIGLFGRPFNAGQNAEVWNNALAELADACNEATAKAYKSGVVALNKDVPSAAKIHSASVASQVEKACGAEGCGFAAEEQMGSRHLPSTNR